MTSSWHFLNMCQNASPVNVHLPPERAMEGAGLSQILDAETFLKK